MKNSKDHAYKYIDSHLDDHICRIQKFIQLPTVSTEGIGVVEGAYMLLRVLKEIGFPDVELVDVGGRYPGVWASINVGARKTIASYGFLDSRPVGKRPWTYQAFCGAVIRDPEKGRVLIGRGSSSPKGPLMAWLNALESMIKTDTLPVNVMLLLEGEELCGSPSYPVMFARYRDRLATADACFAGGMTQDASGGVSLELGFRGLLYLELEVSGTAWRHGPIGMAAHSSLKSCLESPVSRLAYVLTTLTDRSGAEIRIPGLLEKVIDPPLEDMQLLERILDRFGEEHIKEALGLGGAEHVTGELSGRSLLMQYTYAPSLNINGLYAGYTGPGEEVFTIPERAVARLDFRLPPGLTCEHTLNCLREHLGNNGFSDVTIRVLSAADWSRTPLESDIVQAVLQVYQTRGLEPVVWPYRGGGGPWSLFRTDLGIPIVLAAGVGGGGRRDRGDEYLIIDGDGKVAGLTDAEKSHVDIVHAFADR